MIRICVAGATGRMGSTLIREAMDKGFELVGAIAAPDDPGLGKTLHELGICNLDVTVVGPSARREAIKKADVYISFTTPEAEISNIPEVANAGKRIVMGTTGLAEEQMSNLKALVSCKVPAVFAPNFSIGVNFLLKMLETLKSLPKNYDVSIVEAHHSKKKDAPSGTALSIAKLVSALRGYKEFVHGRNGTSPRSLEEIEVLSIRGGGIPGIHQIIIAGAYDMISIDHVSFSRNAFAQGALYAAEWVMKQTRPGVYSMDDVLSG